MQLSETRPTPVKPPGYRLAVWMIHTFTQLMAKVEVMGTENIPSTGPCIIVANHLGRMDALLVHYLVSRDDVLVMVAEKYRKIPIMRWLVKQTNGIFIERFSADFSGLRVVIRHLRSGGMIAIAPEGTRSQTEALIEGKPGAAYLAARLGVPLLPACVTGSEDRLVNAQLRRLRRPLLKVKFGDPFYLPKLATPPSDEQLKEYTDEIMCHIAALLPARYHGIYAGNPRLQELLGKTHTTESP